jgi:hypothetical protein
MRATLPYISKDNHGEKVDAKDDCRHNHHVFKRQSDILSFFSISNNLGGGVFLLTNSSPLGVWLVEELEVV